MFHRFLSLLLLLLLLFACHPKLIKRGPVYDYTGLSKDEIKVHKKVEKFLQLASATQKPIKIFSGTRIDSVKVNNQQKQIYIYLNKPFSFVPFREKNVVQVYQSVRSLLPHKFKKYQLTILSMEIPIQELIPNFYRKKIWPLDKQRLPKRYQRPLPIVRKELDQKITHGLVGRNIVLWNSHGWYFNNKIGRWEWQRPRLFETVEDLLPTSFVIPYLLPMLENAGAYVFLPRERDIQYHEVIVDNDSTPPSGKNYAEFSYDNLHVFKTGPDAGFAIGKVPYRSGENPFTQGTYRFVLSDSTISARFKWTPLIPQTGHYAVYISYHADSNGIQDAHYTVLHAGGKSHFLVNQTIGGSTWLYLGTFKFKAGIHPDSGSVELTNQSRTAGRPVSADAVRFGGGFGNVARQGVVSGRPRFMEGARYYLQFAGMPDTLVYNLNADTNDYKDDYQCRAEYANYLYGQPFGPNNNRQVEGLKIPIDLSLAFHTDAGFNKNDSIIGTLAIYSLSGADSQKVFPDSVSRLANRDFADLLQTQIVDDIRAQFDFTWQRRALREAQYSENSRPNMPSALLELLSHQNFRDMQFALDPRFRFAVSRAIYKAMLKFINTEYHQPFVVQPLPVTHFSAIFDSAGNVVLSWQPQFDFLEPTAKPDGYLVYQRINDGGFDEGFFVNDTTVTIKNIQAGQIYSFKVCAFNSGGKSFPSEILAVYRHPNTNKTILVVNGFDRVCGPSYFAIDSIGGFLGWLDNGVPDHYDLNFTGYQFNWDRKDLYRSNDAPGFGASYADFETRIIPGNTFDFVYEHGKAIKAANFSFVSCSDEALMERRVNPNVYPVIDLILGEEKRTPWPFWQGDKYTDSTFATFPKRLQRVLKSYLARGHGLLVSGAYTGSDLFGKHLQKAADVLFAKKWLRIEKAIDHASRLGTVTKALRDSVFNLPDFRFNTRYHPAIYTVESPDALYPMGDAWTCLRYAENGFSAGVAFKGYFRTIALGFPIETIIDQNIRNALMAQALHFLLKP